MYSMQAQYDTIDYLHKYPVKFPLDMKHMVYLKIHMITFSRFGISKTSIIRILAKVEVIIS